MFVISAFKKITHYQKQLSGQGNCLFTLLVNKTTFSSCDRLLVVSINHRQISILIQLTIFRILWWRKRTMGNQTEKDNILLKLKLCTFCWVTKWVRSFMHLCQRHFLEFGVMSLYTNEAEMIKRLITDYQSLTILRIVQLFVIFQAEYLKWT